MTVPPPHSGLLAGWGRFVARFHWLVLLLSVGAFIGLGAVARGAGGEFVDEFSLPGVESQGAIELLADHFPSQAGASATVVFSSQTPLDQEQAAQRVAEILAAYGSLPGVVAISSPLEGGGGISQDRRTAFATLQYAGRAIELEDRATEALLTLTEEVTSRALIVEVGGPVVRIGERQERGTAELVGLATASIVLLIAFGSVVAMGLPIFTALLALGSTIMILTLATRVFNMGSFTPAFASMIGLGVGIDYALFVVTRFREELATGRGKIEAVAAAVDTAGRAVIFAGAAVVIALLGLFAIGIPFIAAIGVAGAVVVGVSVLIALVVLPALLAVVGDGVNRWRLGVFRRDSGDRGDGVWYRFALFTQRHAAVSALLATAVLLVLASPVLTMRLGSADDGNSPESFHSRRAYDLLAEGFGPGFNGPLLLAASLPSPAHLVVLQELAAAAAAVEGVAAVTPPVPSPDGQAAVMRIVPAGAPQDESTGDLIRRLRDVVIPRVTAGTGVEVFVGGQTAVFEDIRGKITERLPAFLALVIGLSFVLLMLVFRSFFVPLKAAAMNLLAIGAAYGVLVAIFQWGWFADAVGIGRPGPIESFAPMMLFAILFGLSMDYEVFLLSRVRENYVKGDSNSEAIARGVAQTAKVITAAAAIMVAVFMSFALSEGRTIKLFGLGLATAIFLDATIVRLVLVPAAMGLLGDLNWWFPRWLDRLLPRLQIEGSRDAGPVERAAPPAVEPPEAVEAQPLAPAAPPRPLAGAAAVPAAAVEDAAPPTSARGAAARRPRRDYMKGGRRIGADYMR